VNAGNNLVFGGRGRHGVSRWNYLESFRGPADFSLRHGRKGLRTSTIYPAAESQTKNLPTGRFVPNMPDGRMKTALNTLAGLFSKMETVTISNQP
jgi:hypothetical protein